MLFISNFQMTLEPSVTLAAGAKIQYLCMLLCGKAISQIDTLFAEVGSTTLYHLKSIILGLSMYFLYQCNVKTKAWVRRRIRKPRGLKVKRMLIVWFILISIWLCSLGRSEVKKDWYGIELNNAEQYYKQLEQVGICAGGFIVNTFLLKIL